MPIHKALQPCLKGKLGTSSDTRLLRSAEAEAVLAFCSLAEDGADTTERVVINLGVAYPGWSAPQDGQNLTSPAKGSEHLTQEPACGWAWGVGLVSEGVLLNPSMVLFVSALIESRNLDLISFNLDELISLPYALKIKKLFETNKNDQIIRMECNKCGPVLISFNIFNLNVTSNAPPIFINGTWHSH